MYLLSLLEKRSLKTMILGLPRPKCHGRGKPGRWRVGSSTTSFPGCWWYPFNDNCLHIMVVEYEANSTIKEWGLQRQVFLVVDGIHSTTIVYTQWSLSMEQTQRSKSGVFNDSFSGRWWYPFNDNCLHKMVVEYSTTSFPCRWWYRVNDKMF